MAVTAVTLTSHEKYFFFYKISILLLFMENKVKKLKL